MTLIQPADMAMVELARDKLWDVIKDKNDMEVVEFINQCRRMANFAIDCAEQKLETGLLSQSQSWLEN